MDWTLETFLLAGIVVLILCGLKVEYGRGQIERMLRISDEDQRSTY